jgi:hypothetical protein
MGMIYSWGMQSSPTRLSMDFEFNYRSVHQYQSKRFLANK